MTKAKLKYIIALLAGILVLVNLISSDNFFRLDFTEDQRYTLSESTLNIIKDLQDPVTVKAYFSEDLQPRFDRMRQDFMNLLEEYSTRSDQNVVYKFINPNESKELERKARQNGIQPLVISSREKNQSVQKRAYMGAVINYGNKTEVIPFLEPGAQMEYALTMAIRKMTVPEKKPIGFISGHGEASMREVSEVMSELNVLYAPEPATLNDTVNLEKYKTLVWVRPQDSIPEAHFAKLDEYMQNGGNLVLAYNQVDANLRRRMGRPLHTGISDWLSTKGVNVKSNFVIDANCGNISIRQQQGSFTMNTPISFPYLPIVSNFADHPISKGLSGVMMQFASSMEPADSTVNFIPLAMTSKKSDVQRTPLFFNVQKQWTDQDFSKSNIPVGALVKTKGENTGNLVVFTDGDFVINGTGQNARQLQPDNVSLLVNSVDYLSDDTGLMALRTKTVKNRPIDQIKESKQNWIKAVNFGLPLLLVVIIGLVRYQQSVRIKNKRREESYA